MNPKIYFAAVLGLSVAGPLCAAPAKTASVSAPYTLDAEDVLSIQVINFPDLSVPSVAVRPDGKIDLKLLKSVSVAGKTTDQVAALLKKKWSEYVIDPSISVSLVQKRPQHISFSGYVAKTGQAEYRPGLHLTEALASNGSALPNGDLARLTVTHKDGAKETLDLSHPETKGGTDADILLAPEDVIYVPLKHSVVSVVGEVQKPGNQEYVEHMTVKDALTTAGVNEGTAELSDATITHKDGKVSPLNLVAILREGKNDQDVELAEGDTINVPEIRNKTYVFGNVRSPGFYHFKPGDRVMDALAATGGTGPDANIGKIKVVHVDKAKNTATSQTVDIGAYMTKQAFKENIPLQQGDVIFVDTKGRNTTISELLSPVTSILGLGTSLKLLSR